MGMFRRLRHKDSGVGSIMSMHEVCPIQLGHNLRAWQEFNLSLCLQSLSNLGIDLWVAVDRHSSGIAKNFSKGFEYGVEVERDWNEGRLVQAKQLEWIMKGRTGIPAS